MHFVELGMSSYKNIPCIFSCLYIFQPENTLRSK